MTPDDITRLADGMEFRARLAQQNGGTVPHDVLTLYAAELRTLAQQGKAGDHIEDKLVMVPTHIPEAGNMGQQGGEVTEEMVERAAIAVSNAMRPHPSPRASWDWLLEEERVKRRDIARAAITALAPQPKDAP